MQQMAPNLRTPIELASAFVLMRFLARTTILALLALLSTQGFARAFEGMLIFVALYCVLAGGIRAERPLRPFLTHYDEAAAYGVIAVAAKWLS